MLRTGRRAQLVAFCTALALLAAGGAGYVAWHRSDGDASSGVAAPSALARPAALGPLAGTALQPQPAAVATALASAVAAPALGGALAGLVVDATTGKVLFARNAELPGPPASTVKLLTAAAALEVLGPTARLSTQVLRSGHTLYLVGGGDVTLTIARLRALARRTASAVGTTSVRVRYDTSRWSGPAMAPGWNTGYFSAGDIARLSALEITGGSRDPAAVTRLFTAALHAAGVTVHGDVTSAAAPTAATAVAAVTSAPLETLVQNMLTVSDNDLAEALGRAVAIDGGSAGTFAAEADAVRQAIDRLGLPTQGLELFDTSGLSRLDRVTPRLLVAVLRRAVADEAFRPLLDGLPVAGATGTLEKRYRRGASRTAAGVLRAKTGTLAGVSALAGQVVDADGRLLLFAFRTDRAGLPTDAERALDALASRLESCGCRDAG